jgi:hypothetical protein
MRVQILSFAEDDLEEGYRFYESQADGLGTYFLDTLYSDIDSLGYFAGIHRVDGDVVLGLAVLDCRRNPSWIREKLTNP